MASLNRLMADNMPEYHASEPVALIDLAAQQARIRPRIDAAIARVLDHGQYIMGPEVAALERELAAFTGAAHVVSCANGTDALQMAMMSLGLGAGDAVLCPGFTFTATPEAIMLLGATPVFVDVASASFNVNPAGLAAGLETARRHGLRPVGVIAVDLFGLAADYGAVEAFARDNQLWVIADSAQSFGAAAGGRKAGTFGTITTTSFFPAKPLGCYGDGGALFTQNAELAELLRSIRSHGRGHLDKYDIERVGVNGRLDTMQAAILLEKLKIFPEEIELRQQVANRYSAALANMAEIPVIPHGCQSVWAQYTIRVPAERRAGIIQALQGDNIASAVYYPRPLHQQTAYQHCPVAGNGLPVAERLCQQVLSLPMHPYLTPAQQDRVIDSLQRALPASKTSAVTTRGLSH